MIIIVEHKQNCLLHSNDKFVAEKADTSATVTNKKLKKKTVNHQILVLINIFTRNIYLFKSRFQLNAI